MYSELVRNYNHLNPDGIHVGMRFEFMDGILASMLYVNVACLLENAMDEVIERDRIQIPTSYPARTKLHGKIEYFADLNLVSNRDGLHEVRNRRNEVGHEAFTARSWQDFDLGLATVGNALIELGLIQRHKKYEFIAGRSQYGPSEDPTVLLEAVSFVGVNFEGHPAFRCEWQNKIMKRE